MDIALSPLIVSAQSRARISCAAQQCLHAHYVALPRKFAPEMSRNRTHARVHARARTRAAHTQHTYTQLKELVGGADGHVLFGVDDALFCGDLPLGYRTLLCQLNEVLSRFGLPGLQCLIYSLSLSDAVAALQARPSLLCVHLRLSPGLNFCHTADSIQRLPRCIARLQRLFPVGGLAPGLTSHVLSFSLSLSLSLALSLPRARSL